MVKVFFTVDVEVWCNGWSNLTSEFPSAFERYVYGPTRQGAFGLPYKLRLLSEHGLTGVFFVEPLFAARFGIAPLREIIELIREGGHDVQLHLHPEWADEADPPLLSHPHPKRRYLRDYAGEEQIELIRIGKALLADAGAPRINAFRAGSFGMNLDTLTAVRENGMLVDASFNFAGFNKLDILPHIGALLDTAMINGIVELPLTFFADRLGQYRHLQLGACSSEEIEHVLWHAARQHWGAVVILSHNFELLNPAKTSPDWVVVRRFGRLCEFLATHRQTFQTCGLSSLDLPASPPGRREIPRPSLSATVKRYAEQAWRRALQ